MTWWMVVLLACSGDDPAAGSPSTRGSDSQPGAVSTADSAPPSTSDSGDGDTGGSTDDSASTNTPTGATAATGLGTDSAPTAHTADTGPPTALPDSVVAFQLTEPQCLVEVEIPSGTITPVTCGPKGTSFFRWPRLVPDDRGVFPVEGADVVGVAVVQPAAANQVRPFEILLVDVVSGSVVTLPGGDWAPLSEDAGVHVADITPVATDRAIVKVTTFPSETHSLQLVDATGLTPLSAPANELQVLDRVDDCVWARIDGELGQQCATGWTPLPASVLDVAQHTDLTATVERVNVDEVELVLTDPSTTARSTAIEISGDEVVVGVTASGLVSVAEAGQAVWQWDGVDGTAPAPTGAPALHSGRFRSSPDGTLVAYVAGSPGGPYADNVVLGSGAPSPISCGGSYAYELVFTPEGQAVWLQTGFTVFQLGLCHLDTATSLPWDASSPELLVPLPRRP